ncbi:hypothetical protein NMY22_g19827 [Coprinellus aureogranulatus]|nr:hypothetical protein NMY22_g19827 [Coprinellus aureogranulatus]
MSARTPFFPQASNAGGGDRPPTRNASRPSDHPGSGANAADNTPKLNTSGLAGLKKKSRGSLAGNPSELGNSGGLNAQIDPSTIPRSATADPHAHPQGNGNGMLKSRLSESSAKAPLPSSYGARGDGNNSS